MITVIIAGGSGTRLWPLSTPSYPKHLLRINGSEKSLLQNTYERVKGISSRVFVVTDASHAHHVQEQLSDLGTDDFIIEAARRGTASCIVAGLDRINQQGISDNEAIAFVAADHFVRDQEGFRHSFGVATKVSEQEKRIVLIGVEPDHPATGFGYIKKGKLFDDETFMYNVAGFKEKPEFPLAKKYVQSGSYLWNCGYFVAPLSTFVQKMADYAPELKADYDALQQASTEEQYRQTYLGFQNIAIDYALIEKVQDLLVTPAAFDWMDLGSYGDIHKAVESDEQGNHVHGERVETQGVENSFIQNYEDKPVAVIGLDNVVVINNEHGILVTRKDLAQQVGDVSKRIAAKQEGK